MTQTIKDIRIHTCMKSTKDFYLNYVNIINYIDRVGRQLLQFHK